MLAFADVLLLSGKSTLLYAWEQRMLMYASAFWRMLTYAAFRLLYAWERQVQHAVC
jgi:hypothetical protein